MAMRIKTLEELRAVDTGNYHPVFFDSEGNEFCEHGCAEKAFLDWPNLQFFVSHTGDEADCEAGVQCCDCGRWLVNPQDADEDFDDGWPESTT